MRTLWYFAKMWRRPLPWAVRWKMAHAEAGGYGLRKAGRLLSRGKVPAAMRELAAVAARVNNETLAASVRAFQRRFK